MTGVCSDDNFNIYKLFFIVSPILFFLGLASTFISLAFKRRQNIRALEGKRQEIQHITKVISAYTLIDDDTNLKNARAFANDAFKQYLNKIIGQKSDKETEEKVDILSIIQDLKAQILELKKE